MSLLKQSNQAALWGSILMFFAIAIGAFGSHGLAEHLQASGRFSVFETANRYHFYQALGLLFYASLVSSINTLKWGQYCLALMVLGTILFSGSLYILAITGLKLLGLVTPVGGVLLLGAWGMMVVDLLKGLK